MRATQEARPGKAPATGPDDGVDLHAAVHTGVQQVNEHLGWESGDACGPWTRHERFKALLPNPL
jgi:hypothetical protein